MITLEQLRRNKDKNHPALSSGYFDFKYKITKPKSAAQLEALIEEYINGIGGKVSIISSAGRQIVNKTEVTDVLGRKNSITDAKFIPSTTIRGTPDILGCYKSRAIAIEVKFSKGDRLSEYQIKYKQLWEQAGGLFIVAKKLEDVYFLTN